MNKMQRKVKFQAEYSWFEFSQPCYLSWAQIETQTASFNIWTQVANSIFFFWRYAKQI